MIDKAAMTRSRIIVLALIAAAVIYKTLNIVGQGDSALMFVGLPAVIAIIVAFAPASKTATGTVMKTVTIMLLLAGILLVEGIVCIMMAAPLVYLIGWAVGATIESTRRNRGPILRASLFIPLVFLSVQGAVPGTSGPRGIEATAERVVDMSPSDIERALQRPATFDRTLPAFFRFGQFPRPLSSEIVDGNFVIHFEDREPSHHKLATHTHHGHPQLVLEVAESGPGRTVFVPRSNTTMIAHWATLESSIVEWATTANGTRVRWTIRAQRKLDPIWYFAPMQTYAAQRAADYLIDVVIVR